MCDDKLHKTQNESGGIEEKRAVRYKWYVEYL